jgi:hypothetical protein
MKVSCSDLASGRSYRARLTTPYERAIIVPWQDKSSCDFDLGEGAINALADGRVHELFLEARGTSDSWWLHAVKLFVQTIDGVPAIIGLDRHKN